MTSINSLMGTNSTSSIYGSRNVISGLASGMDTETMIENAVKGYQTKITQLQQKQEMVQWKQEAYRSIIDKMVSLTRKYTSYTSSTNLFSPTFFNKAVKTATNGKYADMVSAIGKTSSNIQIDGVKQLAQAAKLNLGVSSTKLKDSAAELIGDQLHMTGDAINWTEKVKVSNISGGMTMMYGNSAVYLDFGELDTFKDADELKVAIEKKLGETQVKTGAGDYVKASDRIGVNVGADGTITFEDKSGAGNSIYISSATDNMQALLGFKTTNEAPGSNVTFKVADYKNLYQEKTVAEYLGGTKDLPGKEINVTLNGVTKTIKLDKFEEGDKKASETDEQYSARMTEQLARNYQKGLDKAFGAGKITVEPTKITGSDGKVQDTLSFKVDNGSTLSMTSDAGEAMGLGKAGVTSFLNTGKTLGELVGKEYFAGDNATQEAEVNLSDLIKLSEGKINVKINGKNETIDLGKVEYTETAANMAERLQKALDDKFGKDTIKVEANGASKLNFSMPAKQTADSTQANSFSISSGDTKKSDLFAESKGMLDLKVNGETVGKFSEDDTLTQVMNTINGADVGVNIAYSKLTNEFAISAKDTGEAGKINIEGGLSELFGFGGDGIKVADDGKLTDKDGNALDASKYTYVQGQDAKFHATVNGKQMELTRASNTFDMDGMSVTLKGAFGYNEAGELDKTAEPVTFTTTSDSDAIVDAIKSFVEEYNEMVKEIHDAYSTMPNEKSSKDRSRYMPLTEEDKQGMSETAIKNYEEKAKQGILFGSSDLSNLYRQLTSTIQMTGADNAAAKAIGLSSSYSGGLTTLELDENALREALASDPDKVRDVFSKTVDNGASSNGLMYNMKKVLDTYANTSSGSMGLLIQQAGSKYSPNSVNSNNLQKEYDNFTTQIEKWQTKMSDRVDYYTKQFTALEQLVAQMNNQSSMLAGLQGGY